MKFNLIKKIISMLLLTVLLLTACTGGTSEKGDSDTVEKNTNETFTIGISQYMEHPALDASKQGFIDEMNAQGVNVKFLDQNAQGDITNARMIAEKFVKDDVDLIFSIATLSSQSAKQAIQGTDIPMVFTAVTDPVFSQLVSDMNVTDNNITGVVDAAPIKENLELFKELDENIKTIGIIYNTGESNSEVQVNKAREEAEKIGLKIEPVGISSINDISQALDTISKKAESLYIITDNMVASSMPLVAELAKEKGLPTVSADGTHVDKGILASKGISFYEIGRQSADIAKQILVDKTDISEIPVQHSDKIEKKVNSETMKSLGLTEDNGAFQGAEFVD